MATPWKMVVGEVEGEPVVIALGRENGEWKPQSIIRVELTGHLIARVADYTHCPWVLGASSSVVVQFA
jgi:hypothetical protein